VAGATSIARATATFSRKNARFFAGYAFDAHQVPFAWTPPGRVFVGIDLDRTALVDAEGVQEGRGRWGGQTESHRTFRRTKAADPFARLPQGVRDGVDREGDGALAVMGERGPVVVPVRWRAEPDALYAALPAETLTLAGAAPVAPAALTVDQPSAWRARDMVGALLQGEASFYVDGHVGSGAKSVRDLARSLAPDADALVRIGLRRVVWWKGWSSGSARLR
jgi:hypothetical protein